MKKCSGDCTACDVKCEGTPKVEGKTKEGDKVVSFNKEPTLNDVVDMLNNDEGFKKATEGSSIIATRVLRHANGQDAVLQIFFHKKAKSNIIVTNQMPKGE